MEHTCPPPNFPIVKRMRKWRKMGGQTLEIRNPLPSPLPPPQVHTPELIDAQPTDSQGAEKQLQIKPILQNEMKAEAEAEAEAEAGRGQTGKEKKKEKKKLVQNFKSAPGLASGSLAPPSPPPRDPPPTHTPFSARRGCGWSGQLLCHPRCLRRRRLLLLPPPPSPASPASLSRNKSHSKPLGQLLLRSKLEHLANQQGGAPRAPLDLNSPLQTSPQEPECGETID